MPTSCSTPIWESRPAPPAASVSAVAAEEVAAGEEAGPNKLADEPATYPDDHEHLHELIDQALAVLFERPLQHDRDGDVRVVSGKSVIYVQVVGDRPAVDLYAEVVSNVRDLDRAAQEVAILNSGRTSAKFYVRDDQVVMRFRIYAWPFSPTQLRVALADVRRDLDDLAPALATRVDGRLFLEQAPVDPSPSRRPCRRCRCATCILDPDDAHPSMIGLLEALVDGPVAPGVVATMFNGDAELLTSQIARVRSGASRPASTARHCRRAAPQGAPAGGREKAAREAFGRSRSPVRRLSRQLALLPEPEDSPEAGLWSNDHLGETS